MTDQEDKDVHLPEQQLTAEKRKNSVTFELLQVKLSLAKGEFGK